MSIPKMIKTVMAFTVMTVFYQAVYSAEFHVDKSQKNMVKFISDAPIEDFEGLTNQIDGYLYFEGDSLTNKSSLYFEVDLSSLDTGIGLRNRHMRENYLETDKYPITHFSGKIVKPESISDEQGYKVQVAGKIYLHGVERPLEVNGILLGDENNYQIRTKFIVKLSDFNIEIPSIMFYKIDEAMDLELDFHIIQINK